MVITHEIALDNFNQQIEFALNNYKSHGFKAENFNNIVIAGLGGSGIGGRITKNYFYDKSSLPIEVFSDYSLPNYISDKTFVILSSYSGTTEETLYMYEQAKKNNCKVVCISSGGDLSAKASQDDVTLYKVENGFQPRMALGFSLTYNLLILSELFNLNVKSELENGLELYRNKNLYKTEAQNMIDFWGENISHKFVIVTDNATEAIGVRFCQQIQENSKMEAFVQVLPEANHNVFETYYNQLPSQIIFINSHNNDRNDGRFAYLKKLLNSNGNQVFEINLETSSLSELLKTIYITDWFSILLSNKKGADNMSVPNITNLKQFLQTF